MLDAFVSLKSRINQESLWHLLSSFLAKSDGEVKKKGQEKQCRDPYFNLTCPAILGIPSLET